MNKRREKKSKVDQFREGCISLFENSFLDNYESWNSLMTNVNSILSSINDEIPLYQYDEFCIEAKKSVLSTIMGDVWIEEMVCIGQKEKIDVSTLFHKKKYGKALKNIEGSLVKMEQKLLSQVLITSISSRIDPKRFPEAKDFVVAEFEEAMKKTDLSWI